VGNGARSEGLRPGRSGLASDAAQAFAGELDAMGVVNQAIEYRIVIGWVAYGLMPCGHRKLRCDDPGPTGQMEIVLAEGDRILVWSDVETAALSRVVKALRRKRRCDPIDSSGSEGFSDVRFFRGAAMSLEGSEDERRRGRARMRRSKRLLAQDLSDVWIFVVHVRAIGCGRRS
jgi:hypothetical protein